LKKKKEGKTPKEKLFLFLSLSLSLSLSLCRPRLSLFPLPHQKKKRNPFSPKIQQLPFSNTSESAWKLFVYFSLTALAAASTAPFGFFLHTPDFWRGCTKFPPCNYAITRPMGLAYALELGELVGDFEERVSSGFGKGEEEKRKKTKKPHFFSRSKKNDLKKNFRLLPPVRPLADLLRRQEEGLWGAARAPRRDHRPGRLLAAREVRIMREREKKKKKKKEKRTLSRSALSCPPLFLTPLVFTLSPKPKQPKNQQQKLHPRRRHGLPLPRRQ